MPKINPKETKLIEENFDLIKQDFPKYAYLNLKIKNKRAKVQRFILNKLQAKLWAVVKEMRDKGLPVRIYLVKSRQTGSTTFWIGLLYWLCSTASERNALLIAHDDEGAEALGDKFQNLYLRSNPILQPKVRNMNRKETYFATSLTEYEKSGNLGLDCHIDNLTAAKKTIGRSYTYNFALMTEFGLYEEAGINIKSMLGSLFQAVPEEEGTMVIIETTAKGEGYAKDYYENEENGFIKIFISWIADDSYTINLPYGEYFDLSETDDSIYGNELEVKDQIESELLFWDYSNNLKDNPIELYHQTMCRLAWRRRTIHKKCQDDKLVFKQEYPLTVEDAFSTSSVNVFPQKYTSETLNAIKKYKYKPKRYEYIHSLDNQDIVSKFKKTLYGELALYEKPITDTLYAVGGDGSQGIENGDPSALVVVKLPTLDVVAIYEGIIPPHHFAGCAYWLAQAYNNALLGIELNDKGGYAAIQEIVNNYKGCNLFYHKTIKAAVGQPIRYGWVTNGASRSLMISDTKNLMINSQINIYDEVLVKQLRSFVKHTNGKLSAAQGKRDDLVLAMMIAIQMSQQTHIPQHREERKRAPKNSLVGILAAMQQSRGKGRLRV